jgi:hypothetical protein
VLLHGPLDRLLQPQCQLLQWQISAGLGHCTMCVGWLRCVRLKALWVFGWHSIWGLSSLCAVIPLCVLNVWSPMLLHGPLDRLLEP